MQRIDDTCVALIDVIAAELQLRHFAAANKFAAGTLSFTAL